jgi:hypothetical protein
MVEFAVLWLQNPAGAQRPDAFLCDGIHIQLDTVNSIQVKPPPSPLFPPLRQPYLQGTRPFGRSYYNVHSYHVWLKKYEVLVVQFDFDHGQNCRP